MHVIFNVVGVIIWVLFIPQLADLQSDEFQSLMSATINLEKLRRIYTLSKRMAKEMMPVEVARKA